MLRAREEATTRMMALERTAVPREFSSPRRFNRRYRLILAVVILAALSGPVGCMAAIANRPQPEDPVLEAEHADFAAVVAHSYLDGEPLPVPVADGISAAGGRESLEDDLLAAERPVPQPIAHTWMISMGAAVATIPVGEASQRIVETHRFLVGATGGPFVLAVPVIQTGRGSPALGAVPAIEPFVPDAAAGDLASLDWSAAYDTDQPSDTLRERITEWATAFAADDRRQLLEITGDSRNGVEYVGLGSWQLVGEPVVGGLFTRTDGAAGTHVELGLAAVDDPAVTTRVSFDLLIEHAHEPLPEIVAWGPAGGALQLEAYQNATQVRDDDGSGSGSGGSAGATSSTAVPAA
jgi:hypothetical protein